MTLDVPVHVRCAGGLLGVGTVLIGLIYLAAPPERRGPSQLTSVIAVMEPVLGWVMLVLGSGVVLATVLGQARASAHVLATAVHATYMGGLVVQFLITQPVRPTVTAVLSFMGAVAHGGAALAYWQRGYR